jgi:type III secretion system low calcium response chaperone LcrH/SycD
MNQTLFAEGIASMLDLNSEKAISLEEQEQLYAMSYHFYQKGDYATAAQFFTKLVSMNPFMGKYWRGLASSEQMRKEYLAAVHAWCLVALLEERDPLAHFHAAECLFSLNDTHEGLKALQAAESLLGAQDESLRDKILVLKKVHCNVGTHTNAD